MLIITLLLACSGGGSTDKDAGALDDSAATDDTAEDTAPACAEMNSGEDWVWSGECPQMRTPCDIVVDGCALSIDYTADGGMTMGMPYAGTLAGSTVTFEDGDTVTGCVGTLESADKLTGTCDGGCTFTLRQ